MQYHLVQRTPCLSPTFSFSLNDTTTTSTYSLSLHDALPISQPVGHHLVQEPGPEQRAVRGLVHQHRERELAATEHDRSEEHTSELQSRRELVCRLLLVKKKTRQL